MRVKKLIPQGYINNKNRFTNIGVQFKTQSIDINGGKFSKGSGSGGFNNKRSNLYCDHYHLNNHTRAECYKLHGYPSNWKRKKVAAMAQDDQRGSDGDAQLHLNPAITTEQF